MQQTGHVANKLLLGTKPQTTLSGPAGLLKRATWSAPRPLADVKAVGRSAGATVNDVLVGAVSGAISQYLADRGDDVLDLTTMVPINLRPPGVPLPRELGNQFALVMLPLPSGLRSPLLRLAETKRRMDAIKNSPEAVLTFGLINAIGRTHPDVERFLVNFFAAKTIGVTTNVAGPPIGRYLAGSLVCGVLGWVPGSGEQTLGVSIFTYDNTVRVGFKADADSVPHPERLVEALEQELDDLQRITRAV
jgi:WS/DGAT/MGAT family acyltransferase